MATCYDPRHDEPCPDCENCDACMSECLTDFWREDNGQSWGEIGLTLTEQAQRVSAN